MLRSSFSTLPGPLALVVLAMTCCLALHSGPASAGLVSTVYRLELDLAGLREVDHDSVSWRAPTGTTYEIVGRDTSCYFLKILRGTLIPERRQDSLRTQPGNRKLRILKSTIQSTPLYRRVVRSVEVGGVAVLWKYRPDVSGAQARVTGDGTLGAGLGCKFDAGGFTTLQPVAYFGLSQVAVKDDAEQAPDPKGAGTLALGLQLDAPNNVRFGFVVGWDKVFGSSAEGWPHQGRPWVSLALNYKIFSPTQSEFSD